LVVELDWMPRSPASTTPRASTALIAFQAAQKPVALVCHAPGTLRHVRTPDGVPLVQGKNVTGFTNTEEEAVGLTKVVPFLVEDELKAKGGHFTRTDDWGVHVVTDGLLITGQNPASSALAAKSLVDLLTHTASDHHCRNDLATDVS
jgi:putative intracellular protease/amidase